MADFNSLLGAQKETNATLKKIAEAQGVTFETAKEQLQEAKNANRVAGGIKAAETRRANAAKGNKGAAEEQQKEEDSKDKKQTTILGRISSGIGNLADKLKTPKIGGTLADILKGTLFAGLLVAVAKWLNSPSFQKTIDYITTTIVPMLESLYTNYLLPIGIFVKDNLLKFFTDLSTFVQDPSWENLKKFDVVSVVTSLAAIALILAPKTFLGLAGKGLKFAVTGLKTAFTTIGSAITGQSDRLKTGGKGGILSKLRLGIGSTINSVSNFGTKLNDQGKRFNKALGKGLRSPMGVLRSGIGALFRGVNSVGTNLKNAAKSGGKGAEKGLTSLFKGGGKLIGGLGKAAAGALRFAGPAGLIATAGMAVFDGVSSGIDEFKAGGSTGDVIREGFSGAISGLTFGFVSQEDISAGLTSIGEKTSAGFKSAKDAIGGLLSSDAQWSKDLTAKTQAGIESLKVSGAAAIANVKANISSLVGKLPSFDEVGAKLKSFGDTVKTQFTALTGVEIPSFDEVKTKLTNLGTNLASKFEGLTGINLGDKFNDLKEMLPDIGNPLKGLADGLEKSDFSVFGFDIGKKLGGIIKSVTASDEEMVAGEKAQGGKVKAGSMYLVNERGSELFVPNQPGQMISAERTASMMRSGNMANSASQTPIMVSAPTVNTNNQSVSNSTSSVNFIQNPDPIFQRASAFAI